MSPLIIKMSLVLRPPMTPLSKEVGVKGRGSALELTTFSYHDMISKDEGQITGFSSSFLMLSSPQCPQCSEHPKPHW